MKKLMTIVTDGTLEHGHPVSAFTVSGMIIAMPHCPVIIGPNQQFVIRYIEPDAVGVYLESIPDNETQVGSINFHKAIYEPLK